LLSSTHPHLVWAQLPGQQKKVPLGPQPPTTSLCVAAGASRSSTPCPQMRCVRCFTAIPRESAWAGRARMQR